VLAERGNDLAILLSQSRREVHVCLFVHGRPGPG
jgi:hypothetical protein